MMLESQKNIIEALFRNINSKIALLFFVTAFYFIFIFALVKETKTCSVETNENVSHISEMNRLRKENSILKKMLTRKLKTDTGTSDQYRLTPEKSTHESSPTRSDHNQRVENDDGFFQSYVACRTTNEIGDFLAGAFAPLAFFWLAAAVLIQSRQLREQLKQLELQKNELKLTRDEMQEALKVAQVQAAEAAASTKFIGQQTKILEEQQKINRMQFNDNQLEQHIQALQACLSSLVIKIEYEPNRPHDMDPSNHQYIMASKNLDLRNTVRELKSLLAQFCLTGKNQIPGTSDKEAKTKKLNGLTKIKGEVQRLRELLPDLGAGGRAMAVKWELEETLADVSEIIKSLESYPHFDEKC